MPTWDSHGLALLLLHKSSMEVPTCIIPLEFPMCLLWDWMGIDHWEFHGMALWAMHWDPMDLHWGLVIENSMEVLYGQVIGMSRWTPPPWNWIGNAP